MQKMKWCCILIPLALSFFGCLKKELQTGLSEQEAQEIIVLLKESGIEAVKELRAQEQEKPTWAVCVRGGEQNLFVAWRILQEHGLPRRKSKGLEDVFSNSGLIPTAGEEKARLILGLSGEISRTLESVAGVVDARVHVVLPENSPLLERNQWSPTTASVLVKYQGEQLPLKEEEIRNLVSRGVEGLQPENVAVVFKKIEIRQLPNKSIGWYLGSQEVVVASLALLTVSSLGSLILVARGRQQRIKIQTLQKKLKAVPSNSQLTG